MGRYCGVTYTCSRIGSPESVSWKLPGIFCGGALQLQPGAHNTTRPLPQTGTDQMNTSQFVRIVSGSSASTVLFLSLPTMGLAQVVSIGNPAAPQQAATPVRSGEYTIQALPALGGDFANQNTNATGMNEAGHVAGVSQDESMVSHAVIWVDGQIVRDLRDQPANAPNTFFPWAKGINNNDDAVGQGMAPWGGGGGSQGVPIVYEAGVGIFDPDPLGSSGWSWAINDSGQVGYRAGGTFIYDPVDGVREVKLPNGSWEIWEINNAGVATGSGRGPANFLHAFRYDYDTDTIVDLGADPIFSSHSDGYGINEHGDIAGWGNVAGSFKHPIVWAIDGRTIVLETGDMSPNHLLATAEHINDRGTAVGFDLSVAAEPGIGWIAYDVLSVGPADLTTEGASFGDPGFGVPDRAITAIDMRFYIDAWLANDLAIADMTTTGALVGDSDYGQPDGLIDGDDFSFYQAAWNAGPTSPLKINARDLIGAADRAAWSQVHPFEVNEAGQICGIGVVNGRTRGFLMTPIQ